MPLIRSSPRSALFVGMDVLSLKDAEILSCWVADLHRDRTDLERRHILTTIPTGAEGKSLGIDPHNPKGSAWTAEIAGVHISFGACFFGGVYANAISITGDTWRVMVGDSGQSNRHRTVEGDAAAFHTWLADRRAEGTIKTPDRFADNPFVVRLLVCHKSPADRDAVLGWLRVNAHGPWLAHENTSFPLPGSGWRGVSIALLDMADEADLIGFCASAPALGSDIHVESPVGSNLHAFAVITLLGSGNLTADVRGLHGRVLASASAPDPSAPVAPLPALPSP